jgi:IS5 family transposase
MRMYKYSNGQISLTDFRQPVGMNLKEDNRWVKKVQTIPWLEIEGRCAALFTNRKGSKASAPGAGCLHYPGGVRFFG